MTAEEEPSRAAGGCVLVVLGGAGTAALFAVDEAVGVLGVVAAGWVALYRSARRKGTDLPLPSPTATPSHGDVLAVETGRAASVVKGPGGVTIIHPEIEYVTDPDSSGEVTDDAEAPARRPRLRVLRRVRVVE
ncbi:hypothetical protein [Streptomyces sp. A012304]|uniref:hypothetical protein n=1 Tax=Streptomyces sp. A012304 TaxID=375446 RepID=UPI0022318366|nr:hypothetical protein [Streptomyces sp. A012304]GKQ34578.1 hypothetical protein ALMP_11270 [Streptomyces sp. A012304]